MENIGLGTAAIGRPIYINVRGKIPRMDLPLPEFRKNGMAILEDAYQRGVRLFDTSPGYGLAESLLMEWLEEKNDPQIVIAGKWGLSYEAGFNVNATLHELKEHSLEKLNTQWSVSKKLLPGLKIYQIHSATLETGVLGNRNILARLQQIKKEHNMIIGLTTTGSNQLEVLKKAADIEVENELLFGSFQSTFNIMEQSVLPFGAKLEDAHHKLIIKESMANGRLMVEEVLKKHRGMYGLIANLAAKYEVGADAIAMRFCMDSFPGSVCLSGASSSEQLASNLKATTFRLQEEEIRLLNSYKLSPKAYWKQRKQLSWQ